MGNKCSCPIDFNFSSSYIKIKTFRLCELDKEIDKIIDKNINIDLDKTKYIPIISNEIFIDTQTETQSQIQSLSIKKNKNFKSTIQQDYNLSSSDINDIRIIVDQEDKKENQQNKKNPKTELKNKRKIKYHRSSLFKRQNTIKKFSDINDISNFEEKFREKLFKSVQSDNFPNIELIHLEELMIPFPNITEENDLEKISNNDYLNNIIREIKRKLEGKYLIKKCEVYFNTKENILKIMSDEDINNNNINNNIIIINNNYKEVKYIGINFKMIKENIYVIYFLFADKADKAN
jgi:hypothetical protein